MQYRYYYLLLVTTILSHFILYAPYRLLRELFNGSFTAVFAALAIGCVNAYMTTYVYNTYKDCNLVAISKKLLGNFLGYLCSISYIGAYYIVSFFMFRGLVEIATRFMLPSTPIWFLAGTLAFVPLISLTHTNRSFMGFVSFISLFIIIWFIVYLLLCAKNIHMYYVKASILHSIEIPSFRVIAAAGFFFTGVSHMALFNPEFKKISWKNTCLIYILLGTPIALQSIYIPASILGPYVAQKVVYAVTTVADTISIDLFFIERGSYIILPLLFLVTASDMILYGFVAQGLIKQIIPKKESNSIIIIGVIVSFVILSGLLNNSAKVLKLGSNLIMGSLAYHNFIFTILFILTKLKKGRDK